MNKIIVGDADALIALALESDPHHKKALIISQMFIKQAFAVIFPFTAFPEAITTLKRALNQPEKAYLLNRQLLKGSFQVEYPDQGIMNRASEMFEKTVSKKNTLFDAVVAATAEKLETQTIFSFDTWYSKEGFTLAEVPKASFKKIN